LIEKLLANQLLQTKSESISNKEKPVKKQRRD